jgi:hypothetical protein
MRGAWLIAVAAIVGCDFPRSAGVVPDAVPDGMPDAPDAPPAADKRVKDGLVAFWTFNDNTGAVVRETASMFNPMVTGDLDLTINANIVDPAKFTWSAGFIDVVGKTTIVNAVTPNRISTRVKTTNQITLEVWVRTEMLDQVGVVVGQPARVAEIASPNGGARNIAIGHDGTKWVGQLRTMTTGATPPNGSNGDPRLIGPDVTTGVTQLVLSASAVERTLFVNGQAVTFDPMVGGLINWDNAYQVSFAAEPNSNNPWVGQILMAAIYDRALTGTEVMHNFDVGQDGSP